MLLEVAEDQPLFMEQLEGLSNLPADYDLESARALLQLVSEQLIQSPPYVLWCITQLIGQHQEGKQHGEKFLIGMRVHHNKTCSLYNSIASDNVNKMFPSQVLLAEVAGNVTLHLSLTISDQHLSLSIVPPHPARSRNVYLLDKK